MSRCPKCHEWPLYEDRHQCPPRWTVWRKGEAPEDGLDIYARDDELAVEMWAEQEDQYGDYLIVGGREEPEVYVRRTDTEDEPKRYVVTGEAVPSYQAREPR